MKIGIDISQIAYEGTGVATYTKNLVENLLEIDGKNEYILFFSSLRKKSQISHLRQGYGGQAKLKAQNQNLKLKTYKFPPTLLDFLWNRAHLLPIESLIGKVDLFHSSDWIQPPTKAKKVTTIHDLTPLKFPETLDPKIVQVHKRRLQWVKKECDIIICVSKSTQRDVVELLNIPESKTRVIYEGTANQFSIFNFQFSKEKKQSLINEAKKKYGINGEYILSVGTQEPRKNINRLIEAFNFLTSQYPSLSLVIVGKYGWGENKFRVKSEKLKVIGYVPQEDLPALYAGAKCFVYPSLYEGFGLPVLEAMTVGCPVVTSDVSSLPEVGGQAAVYCQPTEVNSIKEAIIKVLSLDSQELDNLKKNCLVQAAKFSWIKTAEQTLGIYEEIGR